MLNENLKEEAGARAHVPRFVLLLTDGKSQDDAIAAASKLKSVGVEIIAVGETYTGGPHVLHTSGLTLNRVPCNDAKLDLFALEVFPPK